MRGQDVRRAIERARAISFAILKRHNLDAWILLFDGVLKSLFALIGRNRSGFYTQDGHLALAAESR